MADLRIGGGKGRKRLERSWKEEEIRTDRVEDDAHLQSQNADSILLAEWDHAVLLPRLFEVA